MRVLQASIDGVTWVDCGFWQEALRYQYQRVIERRDLGKSVFPQVVALAASLDTAAELLREAMGWIDDPSAYWANDNDFGDRVTAFLANMPPKAPTDV